MVSALLPHWTHLFSPDYAREVQKVCKPIQVLTKLNDIIEVSGVISIFSIGLMIKNKIFKTFKNKTALEIKY